MRRTAFTSICGVLAVSSTLAQAPTLRNSPRETQTCDTTYVGPPGGSVYDVANWTNGLPRPGDVACFPDDQRRAGSVNPPDVGGLVSAGIEVRIIRSTRERTGGSDDPPYGDNPPPPTATGSCCLGSTCVQTDAFDCRELGGYFLEGAECTESTCATGVCCTDEPACTEDDGAGGDMDEGLCDSLGGNYVGGALCGSTDPCQPHRIPPGYEIVDIFSWDMELPGRPALNNCGQIVFDRDIEPSFDTSEIFLYDNGLIERLTYNDHYDYGADINDDGTIVFGGSKGITLLNDGQATIIGGGRGPIINNFGHVLWPATYFYDGYTVRQIADQIAVALLLVLTPRYVTHSAKFGARRNARLRTGFRSIERGTCGRI